MDVTHTTSFGAKGRGILSVKEKPLSRVQAAAKSAALQGSRGYQGPKGRRIIGFTVSAEIIKGICVAVA